MSRACEARPTTVESWSPAVASAAGPTLWNRRLTLARTSRKLNPIDGFRWQTEAHQPDPWRLAAHCPAHHLTPSRPASGVSYSGGCVTDPPTTLLRPAAHACDSLLVLPSSRATVRGDRPSRSSPQAGGLGLYVAGAHLLGLTDTLTGPVQPWRARRWPHRIRVVRAPPHPARLVVGLRPVARWSLR